MDELVSVIKEWEVISAVSIAEVVAGRVEIIMKFKRHIDEAVPEKAGGGRIDMQTYVRDHPWLIGHQYEHLTAADMHHEKAVEKWIADELDAVDKEPQFKERDARRFDLLCIRDETRIVILELMRPGVPADYDHLMRLNRYVTRIEAAVHERGTRAQYRGKSVWGILIADDIDRDSSLAQTLQALSAHIEAVTWRGLFENVMSRYREFLNMLRMKAPDDPRLKGLMVRDAGVQKELSGGATG